MPTPLLALRYSLRGSRQAASLLFGSASVSLLLPLLPTRHEGCRRTTSDRSAEWPPLVPIWLEPMLVLAIMCSMRLAFYPEPVRTHNRWLVVPPLASWERYPLHQCLQAETDRGDLDNGTRAQTPVPSGRFGSWAQKRRSPICHGCQCPASPSRSRCRSLGTVHGGNRPSPSQVRLDPLCELVLPPSPSPSSRSSRHRSSY